MINRKRNENERKFPFWEETSYGGRIYWLDVPGKYGWKARYLKEVDRHEKTIKYWQEIFDNNGVLAEIHEKYPIDKGHIKL